MQVNKEAERIRDSACPRLPSESATRKNCWDPILLSKILELYQSSWISWGHSWVIVIIIIFIYSFSYFLRPVSAIHIKYRWYMGTLCWILTADVCGTGGTVLQPDPDVGQGFQERPAVESYKEQSRDGAAGQQGLWLDIFTGSFHEVGSEEG